MKRLTATELRRNLYRILDEVAERGETVRVDRRGRRISIRVEPEQGRLARLSHHKAIVGDPEDLVHLDWSRDWKGESELR